MITLTRISAVTITYPITATQADGTTPASIDALTIALLPANLTPRGSTQWQAATFANGELTVKVCGPNAASTTGHLILPLGASVLWAKPVIGDDVDPVLVDRFTVA